MGAQMALLTMVLDVDIQVDLDLSIGVASFMECIGRADDDLSWRSVILKNQLSPKRRKDVQAGPC